MDDDEKPTSTPALSPSYFLERTMRRVKHAAGRAEPKFRKVALDAKIAGKPLKRRSEKSRLAWRVDPKRDEKIFSFINKKLRLRQSVRLTDISAHTVLRAGKMLADADRAGIRAIPELGLPHWDHSSGLLKMLGWALASREIRAVPFSLRLSSDVIALARADPRGVGRHLQDRIARHLRYRVPAYPPTFWFALERGIWDEPHLHGAVVIPDGHEVGVKEALRSAGGEWKSASRQLSLSPRGNLVKWIGYSTKWLFGSMVRLGDDNLVGATQTLRRKAKEEYQAARKGHVALYP